MNDQIADQMTDDEIWHNDPVALEIMKTWASLEPDWTFTTPSPDADSQISRITHYALASRSADLFGNMWIDVFKGVIE